MLREDYPRIVITSEKMEKTEGIRRLLLKWGVFSEPLAPDDARHSAATTDLLLAYSERYSSRVYAALLKAGIEKSVYVGEGKLYADTAKQYTSKALCNIIFYFIKERLGMNIFYTDENYITTNLYGEYFILFRGSRIILNVTESVIVHFLARAALLPASVKDIAEYVCISESSVPVIINSINKKVNAACGRRMIKAVRNVGYYIVKT